MKLTLRFAGCLAAVATAGTIPVLLAQPGTLGSQTAQAPQPVHTNKAAFRIPYQYDPHEIARLGAKEIRLFVSQNRGNQWQHVQSVQPQAGRFDFRASTDGEYWFTVQTVDKNGQLHPGGQALQPGLAVVVDTSKPVIDLELHEREPGKVSLMWTAADANLLTESVFLEFTQSGMTDWQPLAVKPSASGQTSWSIPSGGLVAVRARAKDLAGNEVTSQHQIQINATGSPPAPVPRSDLSGSVAQQPMFAQPPALSQMGPAGGMAFPNPAFSPAPLPQTPPGPPAPLPGTQTPMLSQQVPYGSAGGMNPYGTFGVPSLGSSQAGIPGVPLAGTNLSQNGIPSGTGSGLIGQSPQAPSGFVNGPSADLQGIPQSPLGTVRNDQFISTIPGRGTPQPLSGYETGGSNYRTVNSRKFHIDYRIDDIGPSGVQTVELFITQNNGEKWYRYGIDEDRRSPIEVEVPTDGVYGFALRVVSGAGLTDSPPQPGERPEQVIVVDSSPPVVQLFPLRQGQGADSNRILITWQAADQKLADRPIALSFSSTPNGPWEPIADWLPNSGQYIWQVGAGIPARLYVRVVARDSAGNLARVDTPQPVLVDLAKPTARIVDVETVVGTHRN